jgi:DNA-binding CsgD family transcriptional regulator
VAGRRAPGNIPAELSSFVGRRHELSDRAGLRMAAALRWFWGITTALREGRSWLVRLLEVGREPSRERARALSTLARLLVAIGSPEGGVAVAKEALDLTRSEDPERLPRMLGTAGLMLLRHADSEALPFLEESVALCRERGLGGEELAYSTFALAQGLGLFGPTEAADALFAESIELCREAGDACWQGVARTIWAFVAWVNGDFESAEARAIEGLRVSRLVPDLHACALGLNLVALVRVGQDDRLAAALLGTADRHWTDGGGGSILQAAPWAELTERANSRCQSSLGEAEFETAYRAGQEESLEDAAARMLGERPLAASPHVTRESFGLTRREREVGALVAEGLSNRDIAARLVISQRTAETHVQNMLAKTGFSTRSQLAVWCNAQNPG